MDQELGTLGNYIPECVEGAVGDCESIIRVRFEGLAINASERDARHQLKVFRS